MARVALVRHHPESGLVAAWIGPRVTVGGYQ